jgi:hypothetical protein
LQQQSAANCWDQIFNRYDVTVMNPEKPWHSLAYGIFVQHDQWVRVTRRSDLGGGENGVLLPMIGDMGKNGHAV